MAGQPYWACYTRDITTRKNVKLLRSEGKALWAWILFNMHIEDVGEMRHTPFEYGVICDLPEDEVKEGIRQMETHSVGNIIRHEDDTISISSNRMQRDIEKRAGGAERTRRWRERKEDGVTDASPPVSQEPSQNASLSRAGSRAENESDIDTEDGSFGKEGDARGGKGRKPWTKADVERIYQAYPRHVGPDKAAEKIEMALLKVRDGPCPEDPVSWLLERVEIYARSPVASRGRFTPHPATWFHQGRYKDDPKEWERDDDGKSTQAEGAGRRTLQQRAESIGKYDKYLEG